MAQNPPSESLGDPSKGTFGRQLYFPYCPLLPLLFLLSPTSPTFHPFPTVPYLPDFPPFPTFSHCPLLSILFHTFSYLFTQFPTFFAPFPYFPLLSLTSPTFAYFFIPFHICSYLFLPTKIGKHIKQVGTLMKSMKML